MCRYQAESVLLTTTPSKEKKGVGYRTDVGVHVCYETSLNALCLLWHLVN